MEFDVKLIIVFNTIIIKDKDVKEDREDEYYCW